MDRLTGRARGVLRAALLASTLLACNAYAEGNCPRGFYPIGGQGVVGCAPIPGAGGGQSPAEQAPQPRGQWAHRYGALASSADGSQVGASSKEVSREAAAESAMRQCIVSGKPGCKVIAEYANQCISWAIDKSATTNVRGGFGDDVSPARAREEAVDVCRQAGGKACAEHYAECSLPDIEY